MSKIANGKQGLAPDDYIYVIPAGMGVGGTGDSGVSQIIDEYGGLWGDPEGQSTPRAPNLPLPPGLVWVQRGDSLWLEKQSTSNTTYKESL